jgi:hypothetical protein
MYSSPIFLHNSQAKVTSSAVVDQTLFKSYEDHKAQLQGKRANSKQRNTLKPTNNAVIHYHSY